MDKYRIALFRLQTASGVGHATLNAILDWAGDDLDRLDDVFAMDAKELDRLIAYKKAIPGLLASAEEDAVALAEVLADKGISVVSRWDAFYPRLLAERMGNSAPALLYCDGDPAILTKPGVAFSGSRKASRQGIEHTVALAKDAVRRGFTVISGGAVGVDAAAHSAALEAGGETILVMPQGILRSQVRVGLRDVVAANRDRVLIVSEFPPHMPWANRNGMIRNKTLVCLAEAVAIIEAGVTGGTLDAGHAALKQAVPVYALDYADPPASAEGNAILIAKGAGRIDTAGPVVWPEAFECGTAAEQPPDQAEDTATQGKLF